MLVQYVSDLHYIDDYPIDFVNGIINQCLDKDSRFDLGARLEKI